MPRLNPLQILRRVIRRTPGKGKRLVRIAAPPLRKPVARKPAGKAAAGSAETQRGRPANNTTCDIYRGANAPPGDPDVAAVPCALIAAFREGSEASEGDQDFRFTHLLYCDVGVDIRDNYPNAPSDNNVFVPDQAGTQFEVVFVEQVNRGQAGSHLRVFLDRRQPTWPTSEL
jgi:hypothetical protein